MDFVAWNRWVSGLTSLTATLILLTPTTAADWLMVGGDSAGTGFASGDAPAWPDTALRLDAAALRPGWYSPPVIVGHHVFVAWDNISGPTSQAGTEFGLWHLDTRTGEVKTTYVSMRTTPGRAVGGTNPELAVIGDSVYLAAVGHVAGYNISTSQWGQPIPVFVPQAESASAVDMTWCCRALRMVASAGKLYIARVAPFVSSQGGPLALHVVDPVTRTVAGPYFEAFGGPTPDVNSPSTGAALWASSAYVDIRGLAVEAGRAVVVAQSAGNPGSESSTGTNLNHVWSIDVNSGAQWSQTNPYQAGTGGEMAPPTIGDGLVFARAFDLAVFNLTTGNRVTFNYAIASRLDTGSPMAFRNGTLYAPIGDRLYALDPQLRLRWNGPARLEGLVFQPRGIAVYEDTVIAVAGTNKDAPSVLVAFDSVTGDLRWRVSLSDRASLAAGNGFLVVVERGGLVTALGDLPVSIRPRAHARSVYPVPGETVVVDLSGTPASPLGGPVAYRADWGDGNQGEWTSSPILRHVYATAAETQARFYVRNDAGQIATSTVTFHVGQNDPRVNILNSPFADDYKETSFFLLGLVVTALAALFGILRAGRKRRRLHRELRELEAEFRRLHIDAAACDAMLAERRARARGLFLERRLEEAHSSFLIGRVDELRHRVRLAEVDDRLDFLPQGMVRTLREMLLDARITSWERRHFLDALDRDAILTTDQKRKVAKMVDGWFARDAGAMQ